MATPPIIQPPPLPPAKKPFAAQAAQASLLAPIVAVAVAIFVNVGIGVKPSPTVGVITGCLLVLLIVLGFIFAVIALAGVHRHGKKGILGFAVAGVCINAILIAFMIFGILAFKAKHANEIQRQQTEQKQ